MTSTSTDGVVVKGLPSRDDEGCAQHDLRTGTWTRLGSTGVLGDAVTERVLDGLAERSHQAARAQGYAQGWAEGRRLALAQAAEAAEADRAAREADRRTRHAEQSALLAALDSALAQLATRTAEAVAEVAGDAVELALTLAEAVVGRELATAVDPGADALRRALRVIDPAVTTTVRLHPADRATLDPQLLAGRDVVLVDDPGLARGDAVAETPETLVDATIGAALERVREVLIR